MSNPYPKPKIQDEGLEKYLNRTAAKHNNQSYKDFVRMLESSISVSSMSKLLKVDRRTVEKYIGIYQQEKAKSPKA